MAFKTLSEAERPPPLIRFFYVSALIYSLKIFFFIIRNGRLYKVDFFIGPRVRVKVLRIKIRHMGVIFYMAKFIRTPSIKLI